jgi:hypothetical protein
VQESAKKKFEDNPDDLDCFLYLDEPRIKPDLNHSR